MDSGRHKETLPDSLKSALIVALTNVASAVTCRLAAPANNLLVTQAWRGDIPGGDSFLEPGADASSCMLRLPASGPECRFTETGTVGLISHGSGDSSDDGASEDSATRHQTHPG